MEVFIAIRAGLVLWLVGLAFSFPAAVGPAFADEANVETIEVAVSIPGMH